MLWFFIAYSVMIVATVIFTTLAIIFTYQHSLCELDPHIICHADYQCNHDSNNLAQTAGPDEDQYTIFSHFLNYSNSCLFGKEGTESCGCKKLGFAITPSGQGIPNPYDSTAPNIPLYTGDSQNLCNSSVYPEGTMVN